MEHTALLMPWFQRPERTNESLQAVKTNLQDDYQRKGLRHGDVAWRNVGVCKTLDEQLKAVVFDMQTVKESPVSSGEQDWVGDAIESLERKLN